MLQPVRTRWRKAHKGRIHGTATRASSINYGAFALKALQPERITGKQIEAARVALTRHMKRQGRVWTRVFPNIPVSKKPIEVRMGKGKGNPEFFACKKFRISFTFTHSYFNRFFRYGNVWKYSSPYSSLSFHMSC